MTVIFGVNDLCVMSFGNICVIDYVQIVVGHKSVPTAIRGMKCLLL